MPPYHPDLITIARAHEPERLIAATLAREPQRDALIALAAFCADLRRIPFAVKDPMIGEIRLQWWRDAIAGFDQDATTGHPIADALNHATRTYSLPPTMLIAMTEARAFDLYPDPMPETASLDGYLSKTETIPFDLALRITMGTSEIPRAAADCAGRAFGLARLLVELPQWLARGRLPLPLDQLAKHGIDPAEMLEGRRSTAHRVLIEQLISDIAATLAAATSHFRRLPRQHRVALLPIATIAPRITVMQSAARDPVRTSAELAPLTRVWRVGRAHAFGL